MTDKSKYWLERILTGASWTVSGWCGALFMVNYQASGWQVAQWHFWGWLVMAFIAGMLTRNYEEPAP